MSDDRPEAPPQFSPDGRYWWDGESWIRVQDLLTDPPAQPAERPAGEAGRGAISRQRGLIAVAAALVVIIVVVAAAAYLHVIPGIGTATPTPAPTAGATLPPAPPPTDIAGALDNAGISDDGLADRADFDGYGYSYSAEALANAGVYPGLPLTAAGMTFTWPSAGPGKADNLVAQDQTIPVRRLQKTARIGFLGSSTGGAAHGEATLNYSDGTSTHFDLGFSDWTLDYGKSEPAFGNVAAARMTYRNCDCGQQKVATWVFLASLPVDPSKTLTSVQLPQPTGPGMIHVFAIGVSTRPMAGPVIESLSPSSAAGGQQVTIIGRGFGDDQGTGYVTLSDQGTTWANPNSANPLVVDSWSATRITFTVPTTVAGKASVHAWAGTAATIGVVDDGGKVSTNQAVLEIVADR
ncbi:MAG TPA: IPT/TIG domain-containing protein [Candidatus Dormibacteraeota bacterium]|jgi:hypothetical protein|nr:IPT/TIG domain-containing protein [Candidatus Dormibacteraeota bacterium]